MKINPFSLTGINPYTKASKTTAPKTSGDSFADKLEISSAAKDMQLTNEYMTERSARVEQLKTDIASGNYQVDARKVAEDMLKYYRF